MEVTAPPGDVAALPEREADEPGLEDDVSVQVHTRLLRVPLPCVLLQMQIVCYN